MAKKRLEDVAIDRSRSYEKRRRASEEEFKKRMRNEEEYSRTLEIAINLYNYIQNTPGMNRALLAEKLHVSQAYISNLINGKLNPSIKTIERYERILSVRLLPVDVQGERIKIVSSLPPCKVMTTDFFKESGEESNYYAYASGLQVFAY